MAQVRDRQPALDDAISFKWITGYPSLSAYSNFTNVWWNEGLIMDFNNLYGEIVSCDSNRVYQSQVVNPRTDLRFTTTLVEIYHRPS